ncbi:hypothetical protein COY26_01830 [Candidatus Woesearchaeota archaeon CG_4_10_14_0_2_um_filter_33_10]|nr:MAG: hypothetical protein COV14_05575 [Candidatus Woesearchaeota archaeon CG10_big_fil_rev_8_21_14_0_10_33_12]PIU72378.1 MAG: hypothetical protein COS79_03280 [Candidatus Woesearchaeota archaeon CG06_land_8_20_14_3_00_33_13]PIZ53435.1 MAG: hypothetical protein COY26_01830 [Candidatus Woesearchaeota archaeon CG_4_10_14_0_2_um_filter_33_10]
MILQIFQFILGVAFFFFIPGYLLTLILFKKEITNFEKIALSIGLSLAINIFIGLLLAFNKIFTSKNLWICIIIISLILLIIFFIEKRNL